MISIKRIYEPADPADGCRVLVDRLWPRGVKKDEALIDAWLKDIAPSHELRKWFDHDAAKWPEFADRYRAELNGPEQAAALQQLRELATAGDLTLVYSARDSTHNNAVVIQDLLTGAPTTECP